LQDRLQLRNYMTYLAYCLLEKKIEEDPAFERSRASARVARFVRLHETALGQKAEVVVEHFLRHVLPELGGAAKAMVVTSIRRLSRRRRWRVSRARAGLSTTSLSSSAVTGGDQGGASLILSRPGARVATVRWQACSWLRIPEHPVARSDGIRSGVPGYPVTPSPCR
jgi:hypothetical protein